MSSTALLLVSPLVFAACSRAIDRVTISAKKYGTASNSKQPSVPSRYVDDIVAFISKFTKSVHYRQPCTPRVLFRLRALKVLSSDGFGNLEMRQKQKAVRTRR